MSNELLLSELRRTIEGAGRSPGEFHIALNQREPGWVVVRNAGITRHYPMGRETAILLSAELRHGIYGRRTLGEPGIATNT